MIIFRFNPQSNLIIFSVELEYCAKHTIRMALDTASSFSVIDPDMAIRLGFDLSQIVDRQTISTASQILSVPRLVIPSVTLHTETVQNLVALCLPLPLPLGVRGLLGLNFMRCFKITLDFGEGLATFERID